MRDRYGNKHIDILQDWEVEPGCREFSLRVRTVGNKSVRIDLSIDAALVVANEILRMHDAVWGKGIPIDVGRNEVEPDWIMPVNNRPYLCREMSRC